MPNILLTNRCNQECVYCFAQGEMNSKSNELAFDDLKIILDFFEKSGESKVRLMGGEPTLHPKFEKIIDYIFSRGFSVHLFTNGLFTPNITDFLVRREYNIKYSFNINHPGSYSKKQWRIITDNLQRITPFRNSVLGVVIWQEDFNLDYVLNLVSIYFFKDLVLRLANPIIKEKNTFVSEKRYPVLISSLVREIEKFKGKKIPIDFGCGLPSKIFTRKVIQILKNNGLSSVQKFGCDGNTGRFDIAPDLSVFRCFPLFNWQRKKLSHFKSVRKVENYFTKLMEKYQSCNSNIDFIHQGPCFAYLLSRNE